MHTGKMPSILADPGAMAHCGQVNDPFNNTGKPSTKVFQMPLGHVAKSFKQTKLIHNVQEAARIVNIMPGLQNESLLSKTKFADAKVLHLHQKRYKSFMVIKQQYPAWVSPHSEGGETQKQDCGGSHYSP